MINGRPFNEKRDFSVFSWNLSFLGKPFVFRRNFSFLAKLLVFPETFRFSECPFGFLPWLMAGHPLPINSQDHSSKRLTFFLRENPKIPERKNQELAGFLISKVKPKIPKEKESSREKSKENSSLLISVPNPVTSSVEIRTGIKALRLVRPHAPQVVRLARKTLGQESSRIR